MYCSKMYLTNRILLVYDLIPRNVSMEACTRPQYNMTRFFFVRSFYAGTFYPRYRGRVSNGRSSNGPAQSAYSHRIGKRGFSIWGQNQTRNVAVSSRNCYGCVSGYHGSAPGIAGSAKNAARPATRRGTHNHKRWHAPQSFLVGSALNA